MANRGTPFPIFNLGFQRTSVSVHYRVEYLPPLRILSPGFCCCLSAVTSLSSPLSCCVLLSSVLREKLVDGHSRKADDFCTPHFASDTHYSQWPKPELLNRIKMASDLPDLSRLPTCA